MFISLTDADNGQTVDLVAGEVQAIRVLDRMHTMVILSGNYQLIVREAPERIKNAVAEACGAVAIGTRARRYEGGKW